MLGKRVWRVALGSFAVLANFGQAAAQSSSAQSSSAQSSSGSKAQPAQQEFTTWVGYMSDWVLDPRWAIWFDTHYNVRAFSVLRGGLTHRFEAGPSVTAGYAYLQTDSGSGKLDRPEHRPWAQCVLPFKYNSWFSASERIRYDARFRQVVVNSTLQDGWTFINRIRFQTGLNLTLPNVFDGKLSFQVADEVLFNFGENAGPNYLDQNRVSFTMGWKEGPVTFRTGYMDRFIPGSSGTSPTHEHALLFWIQHVILLEPETKPTQHGPTP